ncbi:MAG TPA: adenine nucleotide alpha hydrolase family protein [Candidatus Fimenecus excrementavium]|nr:adenine nucleotide alpha hydrolase family protein [Candidatus Fimenecus excrementavium]
MKKLLSLTRAAVDKYNMIEAGDKIAVGVSGGKDSLALLYALAKLRDFYPKPFSLVAITLDYQFNGIAEDYTAIEALCKKLQVEYIVRRTNLWEVIFETRKEKNPCSLCAKMRRGLLHDTAVANGCNKVALGHHLDDAAETFLMNLLNGGKIGCFSPVSYLSNKKLYLIRPLIFAYEKDVAAAARRANLPVVKSRCPMDKVSNRQNTKELLKALEKDNPAVRKKIIGALERSHIDNW